MNKTDWNDIISLWKYQYECADVLQDSIFKDYAKICINAKFFTILQQNWLSVIWSVKQLGIGYMFQYTETGFDNRLNMKNFPIHCKQTCSLIELTATTFLWMIGRWSSIILNVSFLALTKPSSVISLKDIRELHLFIIIEFISNQTVSSLIKYYMNI